VSQNITDGLCDPASGCDKITTGAADVALCQNLLSCILSTHCGVKDPFQDCFCGTFSAADGSCVTQANGPCLSQSLAATKAGTSISKAGQLWFDPITPSGNATQLIGCEHDFCGTTAPPPFTNVCPL
jgi:hypothetical protein